MKVGDLVIRKLDGLLGIVVKDDRVSRGIIRIMFYGAEPGILGWAVDQSVQDWRLQ